MIEDKKRLKRSIFCKLKNRSVAKNARKLLLPDLSNIFNLAFKFIIPKSKDIKLAKKKDIDYGETTKLVEKIKAVEEK